jgi:hypothetical protein
VKRLDLLRAAGRVARLLGPADCALVGGLAVGAHGFVRATRDLDFAVGFPLAEARERLRKGGVHAVLAAGEAVAGEFPCLKATLAGVRVDVIPALAPIDWSRTLRVPLGKTAWVPVVDLEALLRLKLRAAGPRDLMDVAALVLLHPERLEQAREHAASYGVSEALEGWLRDSRLRAEVEEGRPPSPGPSAGARPSAGRRPAGSRGRSSSSTRSRSGRRRGSGSRGHGPASRRRR